jgi:hypothetical protein
MLIRKALGTVTNIEAIHATMLQPKHIMSAPNDDPMQIDKTQFKPLTK